MIRYQDYDYEKIASIISFNRGKRKIDLFTTSGRQTVNISSLRLQCFKNSPSCVSCGRKGNVFFLEKTNENDTTPHLNLYCVKDGEEILMTHDHIVPRSKGGKDCLGNVQTMCNECNLKKGDSLEKNHFADLRKMVAHLIESGRTDNEIFQDITSSKGILCTFGFFPQGGDLVRIIRELMTESIPTECGFAYEPRPPVSEEEKEEFKRWIEACGFEQEDMENVFNEIQSRDPNAVGKIDSQILYLVGMLGNIESVKDEFRDYGGIKKKMDETLVKCNRCGRWAFKVSSVEFSGGYVCDYTSCQEFLKRQA